MPSITVEPQVAPKLLETFQGIRDSKVSLDDILDILREWETRATLTAKKLFTTTALILAAAFIIQLDYSELGIAGISNANAANRTTFILAMILLSTGFAFWWHRSIDLKMRSWRTSIIKDRMEVIGEALNRAIHDVGEDIDFRKTSIFYPVNNSLKPIQASSSPLNAYYFYREHFLPQESRRMVFERVEFGVLNGLGVIGLTGIVQFWMSG